MSHVTACPMQLVLCNYTNLHLHVSHVTKIQLHATVTKPKISSSENDYYFGSMNHNTIWQNFVSKVDY